MLAGERRKCRQEVSLLCKTRITYTNYHTCTPWWQGTTSFHYLRKLWSLALWTTGFWGLQVGPLLLITIPTIPVCLLKRPVLPPAECWLHLLCRAALHPSAPWYVLSWRTKTFSPRQTVGSAMQGDSPDFSYMMVTPWTCGQCWLDMLYI